MALLVIVFMAVCPVSRAAAARPFSVAACLVVRNQHDDIREWLEWHAWLGVSRVYMYDHMSGPEPMRGVLEDFIASGFVDYTYLNASGVAHGAAVGAIAAQSANVSGPTLFQQSPQGAGYALCTERAKALHAWLAFLDADEFIVLRNTSNPDLPGFLANYQAYGGLSVNWCADRLAYQQS